MKKLLLAAMLSVSVFALKAQTVTNNSACAVRITVTCYDAACNPTSLPTVVIPAFTIGAPILSCVGTAQQTFTICWVNCPGTCATISDTAPGLCVPLPQVAPLMGCAAPPPPCPATSVDYNPLTRVITIR
jgi:hypothetical protein